MPGQLHFGASIRVVPRIPFLQDQFQLLRLLLSSSPDYWHGS
jgi:hypothetical protein